MLFFTLLVQPFGRVVQVLRGVDQGKSLKTRHEIFQASANIYLVQIRQPRDSGAARWLPNSVPDC